MLNTATPMRGLLPTVVMLFAAISLEAVAQQGTVTATVDIVRENSRTSRLEKSRANVAIWLKPTGARTLPSSAARTNRFVLVQKDKEFTPHLLVVPVGSSVEFPNLDPFYHNVFSLFNGKRFDLGLYEAGSKRTVHFDHEGISYIFCNIHPEMGAVVIAVTTPYFAVSGHGGSVELHDVPDGTYELNVWAEGATPESLKNLRQIVRIQSESRNLGRIHVTEASSPTDQMANHKNKFGEDYSPVVTPY